jgi:ABC-type Fe3+ transport system permease subunit
MQTLIEKKAHRKPVIVLIIKWITIVLMGICVVIMILYGIGLSHTFTEQTLSLFFRSAGISGLVLCISSIYGIVLDLWMCIRRANARWLLGALGYLLLLIFGLALAILTNFIIVFMEGSN